MVDEDDDDTPQLSADTLALLKDFNADKESKTKQFESLKAQSEQAFEDASSSLSMDVFPEDWNTSQFWYTDETARILAEQLLNGINEDSAIAVVSAPSVYVALRKILKQKLSNVKPTIRLLEYDKRFEVVGQDFVFYDFNTPFRLPTELKGKFDRIISDPPFLSEDCQTKTALTARYLASTWQAESLKLITCTGERMEATITRLCEAVGVKTTTFDPEHRRGLSNEFRCYANFTCPYWDWR